VPRATPGVGDGKGIVGIRAGAAFQPADLLEPRVQQMNDGELYSVASEGRRTMHWVTGPRPVITIAGAIVAYSVRCTGPTPGPKKTCREPPGSTELIEDYESQHEQTSPSRRSARQL
jgi:hypothetical protein